MEISVIIPAYNEEKNIQNILATIYDMQDLSEILVVNDGSIDKTADIARSFGINVIDIPENSGKGHAMWVGLNNTSGKVILFLDADLVGMQSEQIQSMYLPVLNDMADMTLGIFSSGRGATDLAQKLTPFLTGQRGVKRDVLNELKEEEWISGFGIEIALTRFAKDHQLRILEVPLENVTHTMKEEKLGLAKGVVARLKMYWEIAKEFSRV
ncbi:MAG: glycosyltransferase family 2 protein [Firmicutes bacterium]|nr:glycosyltransferase family 2 protein [Bacillota bacterium]